MNRSLFNRLYKRSKTENEQREDFLTEMLAWMVDTLPQFGQDYVRLLSGNTVVPEQFDVHAEAQKTVAKGKIDLIIYTDTGVNYICEHKVDSGLRDHQLDDYRECIPEICDKYRSVTGENASYSVVLVTRTENQWGQKPDKQLIWHDVYEYFNEQINTYDAKEKLMVNEFLLYLTEEDMGMQEIIKPQVLPCLCTAIATFTCLKRIIDELAKEVDWTEECKGIDTFVPDYKPRFTKCEPDKRFHIEYSQSWTPCLRAGIYYAYEPYHFKFFKDEPVLAIVIEYKPEEKEQYKKSDWFQMLEKDNEKIRKDSGFEVETDSDNDYIVLVLGKSLSEVLEGVEENYNKQKQRFKEEIANGINLILKYYQQYKSIN